ncbi:immunoglobulin domain-containing protein [Polypterus senegalus]|uniref:immunoglobulin domain-containing protein n=1 Tax=Polypterus senegalus TaxID=55291 RepID=UPI0019660417|nr:immunoglobulin domain-containing protein [Polypterus senegalus]
MPPCYLRLLLILLVLHAGTVNNISGIRCSTKIKDGTDVQIECSLPVDNKVAQVNWMKIQDSKRTLIAVYHPQFGLHVHHNSSKVKLNFQSSTQMELIVSNSDGVKNSTFCGEFHMFPVGIVEECAIMDMPDQQYTVAAPSHLKVVTAVVVLLCILLLGVLGCFKLRRMTRMKLFDVRQVFLVDSEAKTAEPEGGEVSRLYMMINADYFSVHEANAGMEEKDLQQLLPVSLVSPSLQNGNESYYALREGKPTTSSQQC